MSYQRADEALAEPSKEGRFRLTIEGDEALMRQFAAAVELQGRLYLGQFDSVYLELQQGIQERAAALGLPISESGNGPEWHRAERTAAAQRHAALQNLEDRLTPIWIAARRAWDATFQRYPFSEGPLAFLTPHMCRRERRAYTVWKWMEHHILHLNAHLAKDSRAVNINVHFSQPDTGITDLLVRVERIDPNEGQA